VKSSFMKHYRRLLMSKSDFSFTSNSVPISIPFVVFITRKLRWRNYSSRCNWWLNSQKSEYLSLMFSEVWEESVDSFVWQNVEEFYRQLEMRFCRTIRRYIQIISSRLYLFKCDIINFNFIVTPLHGQWPFKFSISLRMSQSLKFSEKSQASSVPEES
jgi:hypothetical protein